MADSFLFATGIENSYPTIAGGKRIDEMAKCGHYERFKEDFALTAEMGLRYLRWGPALYKTFTGPGRYDWDWTDEAMAEMQRLGIEPILDLCHFGVPDWLGNFQNPDLPRYFAEYADVCARRYPTCATGRRSTRSSSPRSSAGGTGAGTSACADISPLSPRCAT